MSLRKPLIILAALLAPYFHLYISKYFTIYTWVDNVPVPLGDDYPHHVCYTLKPRRDLLEILQSQYSGLVQLEQHGLFMPAVGTAACKFETYKRLAETLPAGATVSVAWQLGFWLLPYLYQYRIDVSVKVVVCPQDLMPPYVISGRHSDSWYLPCYDAIPPGPCHVHHEDTGSN